MFWGTKSHCTAIACFIIPASSSSLGCSPSVPKAHNVLAMFRALKSLYTTTACLIIPAMSSSLGCSSSVANAHSVLEISWPLNSLCTTTACYIIPAEFLARLRPQCRESPQRAGNVLGDKIAPHSHCLLHHPCYELLPGLQPQHRECPQRVGNVLGVKVAPHHHRPCLEGVQHVCACLSAPCFGQCVQCICALSCVKHRYMLLA